MELHAESFTLHSAGKYRWSMAKILNSAVCSTTLIVLSISTLSVNANATGFGILAPHRAVYDVKLENAHDRSGIKGMNGRIVYEVTGSECEGISVRYRFVTNVSSNSELFITDQQTITYESPDGKEFSFQTKSFVNEVADQKVEGSASISGDETNVKLTGPKKREISLTNSVFVTSHLINVIKKAKDGENFYQQNIYDGTGDADEVVSSTTIIGKPKPINAPLDGESKDAWEMLDKQQAWPVTTSYFKLEMDNTSESLPIYEASFLLHENGISRNLLMTYPDYALKASLAEIKFLDKSPCDG